MMRGQEETSTSRVERRRGAPRESPITSSLAIVMSVEELRSFFQVPVDISLELLDGVAASTIGLAYNSVYFTRE